MVRVVEAGEDGVTLDLGARFFNGVLAVCVFDATFLWKTVFNIFSCTQHRDGTSTLSVRPSIACDDSFEWSSLVIVSFLSFGLSVLFPLLFLLNPLIATRTTGRHASRRY